MSVDIPKLQKRADKGMKTVFCFRKSYIVCKKKLKITDNHLIWYAETERFSENARNVCSFSCRARDFGYLDVWVNKTSSNVKSSGKRGDNQQPGILSTAWRWMLAFHSSRWSPSVHPKWATSSVFIAAACLMALQKAGRAEWSQRSMIPWLVWYTRV